MIYEAERSLHLLVNYRLESYGEYGDLKYCSQIKIFFHEWGNVSFESGKFILNPENFNLNQETLFWGRTIFLSQEKCILSQENLSWIRDVFWNQENLSWIRKILTSVTEVILESEKFILD